MATVAENLQKIMQAVYGREVRQSIHDSIQQCYNDTQAFTSSITSATSAANTAASSASTAATNASAAAQRAATAAQAAEDAVDQINSSSAVVSVNGKSGIVTLGADDVNAVPAGTMASDSGNGLMSSAHYTKLNGLNAVDFGEVTGNITLAQKDTSGTISATAEVTSGATVKVIGVSLIYQGALDNYINGSASVSVTDTTATFSLPVYRKFANTSSNSCYVKFYYSVEV